jgi:hypothetical protein
VVVATGSGSAAVSWSAPVSDGGSPITSYTVTASHGGQTCTTTGASSCTVTGLTNGRSYVIHVRASTAAGSGHASAPVRASLLPMVSFASPVSFTYPAEPAVVNLSEPPPPLFELTLRRPAAAESSYFGLRGPEELLRSTRVRAPSPSLRVRRPPRFRSRSIPQQSVAARSSPLNSGCLATPRSLSPSSTPRTRSSVQPPHRAWTTPHDRPAASQLIGNEDGPSASTVDHLLWFARASAASIPKSCLVCHA